MRDVVVIGAGPSGSHLARRLSGAGLDVLLLERQQAIGDGVLCTGIIGREAFRRFDLPGETILSAIESIRFVSPSGRRFDYRAGSPLAHTVCRKSFDAALGETARQAGCEVQTRCRVEKIRVDPTGVRLRGRKGDDPADWTASLCVLATGYGASLVRQAGFGMPREAVQGAQTEIRIGGLADAEVYLGSEYSDGGFGWAVPLRGDRARIGVVSRREARRFLRRILDRPELVERRFSAPDPIRVAPIPVGLLPTTTADRLMVVGEAAGQVKTTTQGGIFYGLLCAETAAEVIVEAFREGDLSKGRLSVYDFRFRRQIESELEFGGRLRRFASTFTDVQIDRLFDLVQLEGVLPAIRRQADFDWHGPLARSVLHEGFLGSLVRSALGLPALSLGSETSRG